MNTVSRIENFVNELNLCITPNYEVISEIFNNEYKYPALDPIRDEICKCIICGLYQATMTLTNHLLERSLKFCLAIKYSKENRKEESIIEDVFVEGIEMYYKLDLQDTINRACSQGLITKPEKKELLTYRERFRNPYSHADANIFKDIYVKGKTMSTEDLKGGLEEFFKKCFDDNTDSIVPLKNIPFAQGIFQIKIAKNDCIPYFSRVDEIIRNMLKKINQD